MTPKLTPIPETFLTELEALQESEKFALSPAFRDFIAQTAARRTTLDAFRHDQELSMWRLFR